MAKILIVGSSKGIGSALAQQLISESHEVYGTYSKEAPATHGFTSISQLNVLDEAPDFSFLPEVIDGVVYCPGAVVLKPFARIKPEDFVADYQLQVADAV